MFSGSEELEIRARCFLRLGEVGSGPWVRALYAIYAESRGHAMQMRTGVELVFQEVGDGGGELRSLAPGREMAAAGFEFE